MRTYNTWGCEQGYLPQKDLCNIFLLLFFSKKHHNTLWCWNLSVVSVLKAWHVVTWEESHIKSLCFLFPPQLFCRHTQILMLLLPSFFHFPSCELARDERRLMHRYLLWLLLFSALQTLASGSLLCTAYTQGSSDRECQRQALFSTSPVKWGSNKAVEKHTTTLSKVSSFKAL